VRTEIGKHDKKPPVKLPELKKIDSGIEARLHPGVTKRVPPTGESGSPENTLSKSEDTSSDTKSVQSDQHLGEQGLKDSIFSSQMRRLNRELPISDVYHERNIGLNMAQPLSTLIMTNNLQVVQVDHHSDSESGRNSKASETNVQPLNMQNLISASEEFSNIDNLSVIEDAHKRNSLASSARTVIIKDTNSDKDTFSAFGAALPSRPPPQVPPRPAEPQQPWYNSGLYGHTHYTRDEGDGRSMTDSQYSGCSPNSQGQKHRAAESLASQINYMKMRDFLNDQEITVLEEKEVSPNTTNDNFNPVYERMRPREIANYINTQFKMPENSAKNVKRRPINVLPHQKSPLDPRLASTNHRQQQQPPQPQPMWDKNAGFTYTGNFSSDC